MNAPRTPVYSPALPLTMARLKAQLVVAEGGDELTAPGDETTNDLVVDTNPPQPQHLAPKNPDALEFFLALGS